MNYTSYYNIECFNASQMQDYCNVCANAVQNSLGDSQIYIGLAFVLLIISLYTVNDKGMLRNIGLIIMAVVLIYWVLGKY